MGDSKVLADLKSLFNELDNNDDGVLDKTEMAAFIKQTVQSLASTQEIAGDNGLTADALMKSIPLIVENVMSAYDTNKDGRIDFDEFIKICKDTMADVMPELATI